MASSDNAQAVSFLAGEDMSIFRIVTVTGERTASMADAAADRPAGISGEAVLSGDVFAVNSNGGSIVMVELGGTLAAGAAVSSGTDGVAVAASVVGGEFTCGELVEGGDTGDVVSMLFNINTVDA